MNKEEVSKEEVNKAEVNEEVDKKELDKNAVIKEIIYNVLYFAGVILLALFIVKFVVQRTEVEGESMEPTLHNGENLMVDKVTYRFRDPKRFEVIVLRTFDDEPNTFYVKRIIGLPGETIQIKQDGSIYINNEKLEENYGKEVIKSENIGRAIVPITLGEDEYFVIGDNRNNSGDSRSKAVGNVARRKIVGRAWIRIWPLNKFGAIRNK